MVYRGNILYLQVTRSVIKNIIGRVGLCFMAGVLFLFNKYAVILLHLHPMSLQHLLGVGWGGWVGTYVPSLNFKHSRFVF